MSEYEEIINISVKIVIMIVSGMVGGLITYYFTRKTEDYKFLQLQRQKAEAVSRLFAKWIKYCGKENEILEKKEQFDYYEELNQMSIEIALWISDEKLLGDIMARLQNKPEAKTIRCLIGDVRKLILNNKNDDFNSEEVALWPSQDLLKELLENNKND